MTKIRALAALAAFALLAGSALSARAATIVIVNNDGAGEGFNDPTPRAPVGGNPGTTLGAQRLFLFQHAAAIWGAILPSDVVIQVRSQFNPQTCTPTSAVLGSAGPVTVHRDFANAPVSGAWYHQALANKLAGSDQSSTNPDINATFNLNLDSGTCLGGAVWYYGVDGNEGTDVELLPVLLHEMGHGLGFSTTTSGTSGSFNSGFPSVFDFFLMDNSNGLHWNEMSAAQRVSSAISVDNLVWDGSAAVAEAATFLSGRPQMVIHTGNVGTYTVQEAEFGPPLTVGGVTGDVVLADDGAAPSDDACGPLINGGAVAGRIALIQRGTCTFVAKVLAAQNAGAIAAIIYNNTTGLPPMGGTDPSVTIPSVGISQADGLAILANLGGGVNLTLGRHPTLLSGADDSGRPMMYAPNPFQGGSSVSHWDISLTPNALMEPAINPDLHDSVDLAHGHFTDIGWFTGSAVDAPVVAAGAREDGVVFRSPAPNPAARVTTLSFHLPAPQGISLTICDVAGRTVRTLRQDEAASGEHVVLWDGRDDAGDEAQAGIYFAVLRTSEGVKAQRITRLR